MSLETFFLQLITLCLSVGGQFCLKAGAQALGRIGSGNLGAKLWEMATQPFLIGGIALYGISALGYIVVLSRAKLSVAAPLIGISYVFIAIGGNMLFKEEISSLRMTGIIIIMTGVVCVLMGGEK
jgi:drug/metabolite transporter (DMT)-like permease